MRLEVDDVCIFDWDGTTWGRVVPPFHRRCGRRADDGRTLSQAKGSQPGCSLDIHCVGQVWSSALSSTSRSVIVPDRPLTVMLEGRSYRDGVDISADDFYRRLAAAGSQATTTKFQ